MRKKSGFEWTTRSNSLTTVYQPIVKINSRDIIGYEALTRGRGKWKQPEDLFHHAYEHGHTIALDFACLNTAIRILPRFPSKKLLFVNVEPITLGNMFVRGREGEAFLKKIRPYGHRIVFELTEGMKSSDFDFVKKGIKFFRKFGCHFALDDVAGVGSKLLKLISLGPDFIKIDMGLINGISHNHLHQKLVEQLVQIARKSQSGIIAEGVEDKYDLEFVTRMGIHCAQGFYFARPKRKLLRRIPKRFCRR